MVDYLEEIKKIIEDQFSIPAEDIEEDSFLESDLNLTELDLDDLQTTIQNKFQIQIPQSQQSRLKKVSDIVSYLYENVDTAA